MDRLFVEKKPEFNSAAGSLLNDLRTSLQLDGLESLRIVQRYDLEGLDPDQLEAASRLILSEPQVDTTSRELLLADDEQWFAVEYLPGQFDQRADSAAQCVQILTQQQRPLIASAQVIILKGSLNDNRQRRLHLRRPRCRTWRSSTASGTATRPPSVRCVMNLALR